MCTLTLISQPLAEPPCPPSDRQSISAAKLAGIEQDLNLTDTDYQLAVSVLFIGYTLCQGE